MIATTVAILAVNSVEMQISFYIPSTPPPKLSLKLDFSPVYWKTEVFHY